MVAWVGAAAIGVTPDPIVIQSSHLAHFGGTDSIGAVQFGNSDSMLKPSQAVGGFHLPSMYGVSKQTSLLSSLAAPLHKEAFVPTGNFHQKPWKDATCIWIGHCRRLPLRVPHAITGKWPFIFFGAY